MTQATKPGAPECGIYLRIDDHFDFAGLVEKLRHLFFVTTRSAYEKNMHILELPSRGDAEELRGLTFFARQNGFVVVLRDDAALAQAFGADGVMLAQVDDIVPARRVLGEAAIIGLRCANRNVAERGLEQGIDYAGLTAAAPELLAWWATRTDKPGLAEGQNGPSPTNNDCARLVAAGAGFIEAADFILEHPQGVKQGSVDMLYAIDLALEKRAVN